MPLYTRILGYLGPHRTTLALAVLAAAIYAVLDTSVYLLLIPFIGTIFPGSAPVDTTAPGWLDRLLDATVYSWVDVTGDPMTAIGQVILLILAVLLVKNVFLFARTYLMARVEQGVNRDLRNAVYDHLVALDLSFFGRVRSGQIVSRLTTEVEQLRVLVTAEASKLIFAVFDFTVALAMMLLISWKLTLAAFVVVPGAMAIWGPLVSVLRRRDRRVLHLGGEVNAHVQETLAGIRLVKSSAAEERERDRFHGLTQSYFEKFMRAQVARAFAAPMTEVLAAAGTVILLWLGARMVVQAEISGPEFVSFLAMSMKMYQPVKNVAKFPAMAQPGLVAAERVFEYLDAPVTIRDGEDARSLDGFDREISFEDVSFAYRDGDQAVRDVSFTVPRGSVVALVGPSGAGKSTLIDLLARFYDVDGGSISIDGTDVRSLKVGDVRGLMGIVSQETVLFHDTVRANIAYGRPDASAEEIEAAATAAHAHDFIQRMDGGYDSVVGERGVELSGGERQRIAIARALLRDPPILIFDEATSSLDTESERLIQDAIDRLLEGRTVIVIAHRLSTVQKADQILVVEDGRITERGDHEALMERSGTYRRLYEMQFRDLQAG